MRNNSINVKIFQLLASPHLPSVWGWCSAAPPELLTVISRQSSQYWVLMYSITSKEASPVLHSFDRTNLGILGEVWPVLNSSEMRIVRIINFIFLNTKFVTANKSTQLCYDKKSFNVFCWCGVYIVHKGHIRYIVEIYWIDYTHKSFIKVRKRDKYTSWTLSFLQTDWQEISQQSTPLFDINPDQATVPGLTQRNWENPWNWTCPLRSSSLWLHDWTSN